MTDSTKLPYAAYSPDESPHMIIYMLTKEVTAKTRYIDELEGAINALICTAEQNNDDGLREDILELRNVVRNEEDDQTGSIRVAEGCSEIDN